MAEGGLFSISQSREDLDRITHILNLLIKFQIGQFADRVRIGEKLPIRLSRQKAPREIIYKTTQERVRMTLEELGTTFVKFGQLLSTREDIVGVDYAAELSKLQDKMKPFPAEQAKHMVEKELGMPVTELFSSFESEPLASASVAQVHRAKLKNGRRVVVKIQRPGIERTIREDIRIMHYLAHMANKHIPEVRKYDPIYLVNEFERSMMKELDFLREAKSATRLRHNFEGDKSVFIPAIYDTLCTKRVLVMEEVRGARLSEVINSNSAKYDKKLIAHRCAQAFFKMVIVDGFYHADPHPGNIMILDRNVICYLDFGRVGSIDREISENLFKLALFAIEGDVNGIVSHLIRTNMISDNANISSFKADMTDVIDGYYSTSSRGIRMGQLLSDLLSVIGRYEFNRPREVAELTRAIFIMEGVGTRLNPRFNIIDEFEPYAKKVLTSSVDPKKFAFSLKDSLLDIEYMVRDFPMSLRRFMKKFEEGKMRIELAHRDLDVFTADLADISDKLSVAMIFSALIVGSSIIVQANRILGVLGFCISAILGIWLVLKILLS
ncbi:MAG: AarF/UbiB family protein [Candidatus Micrarchaeales archaeon]|jgi:ubiquinone biosynthesis protein